MPTINPYRDFVSSISATEYEQYCTEILKQYAEAENLKDFLQFSIMWLFPRMMGPISLTFMLPLLH